MIKVSTISTVEDGVPTVLAIAEAIAAVSISLWFAITTESLFYIAAGSCIAPILLMRSPESIELGKKLFARGLPGKPQSDTPFILPFTFTYVLLLSLGVRVISTLRHPYKGIKCIPDNWKRTVLCTDAATPSEMVPGT